MKSNSYRLSKTNTKCFESQISNKVIIKIPLDTGSFWEKEYNKNDLINQIVQDFKSENFIDIPDDYFLDFYFQNKSLKINDPIKTLLNNEIPTIYINQIVKKKPIKISFNSQVLNFDLIGKPFFNPFEVFLFSKENKSLKVQLYDENTINELLLNEFCESSSYCNGNNHLFISGGEKKNGEIIDILWEIDLKEQIIAEPTKIIPKKNHSMIFIPNKYVFIIGGNDKKCIYFDIETAEIELWGNLNKLRVEPALLLDKNILYCFDSVNSNNEKYTIEKTDLDSIKPKWNLIIPKIDNALNINNNFLAQKYFGVSKDDSNDIIFIGGDMDNKYKKEEFNYKYNVKENIINASKIPFITSNLKEKTLLSFNKNINFILPNFERDNPEVIFFIKNKYKIDTVNYKSKESPFNMKSQKSNNLYDFNMPKVAIPDPISSINFEQDNFVSVQNSLNLNKNINANNQINNIINYNNNIQNNEFNKNKENNFNNNKISSNFQEPEIVPAKEDLKLSLEFQNNNLLVNNIKDSKTNIKKEKNELNGISFNTNDKEEEEKNYLNTNLKYNNKNIDLNKDINITGFIKGNKSYKIDEKINLKEKEIKNSDINSTNKKINDKQDNSNNHNNLNNLENKYTSLANINAQKNKTSNIKTNLSKEKSNNIVDYNLNGNIPGIKKTIYLNIGNTNSTEKKSTELFSMVGIIKGTGKKSNIKSKNKNSKYINNEENNIKGIQPSKKLSIPKLNLEGKIPEFSESNMSANNAVLNLKGEGNTPSYDINKNSPTFPMALNNNYKSDNTIELNSDNNNNNYGLNNGNIKSNKIELSSLDNIKEFQIEQKNLGQRKLNINNEEDSNIKINIPNKSISPKLENPSLNNNNQEKIILKKQNESIFISGIISGKKSTKNYFTNNISINGQKVIYDSGNSNIILNGNTNNTNMSNSNNMIIPSDIRRINNNAKIGSNIKQKVIKNNLPLVNIKNNNFSSCNVEPIKNMENIDINNIKTSSDFSINKIILGKKIFE